MHILIIPSEAYIPPECPISGIFQRDQAIILKEKGDKVGVVSPNLKSLRFIFKKEAWRRFGYNYADPDGIPVHSYDSWKLPDRFQKTIRRHWLESGIRLFRKYLKTEGHPDIVHCHNALFAGILTRLIKKDFRIPYVITEHSSAFARGLYPTVFHDEVRDVYHEANRLIVVSPKLGSVLESMFGGAAQDWEWVPNVVDPIFEDQPAHQVGNQRKKGPFNILSVGNIDRNKNHSSLVEAFANMFKGHENVFLRIGGEGPLLNMLINLSEKLKVDKQVVFIGYLSRSEVLSEMDRCAFLVLPSHYETFGVVLIEALSRGKPLVATACGGPECIVNVDNGLLVEKNNTAALGSAMHTLFNTMTNYDADRIRMQSLSKFGKNTVRKQLCRIYNDVYLGNRKPVREV